MVAMRVMPLPDSSENDTIRRNVQAVYVMKQRLDDYAEQQRWCSAAYRAAPCSACEAPHLFVVTQWLLPALPA